MKFGEGYIIVSNKIYNHNFFNEVYGFLLMNEFEINTSIYDCDKTKINVSSLNKKDFLKNKQSIIEYFKKFGNDVELKLS